MLEVKHRLKQVVLIRTRGQLTGEPDPNGGKPLLAKAGHKPPMPDKDLHAEFMLDLFLNREPGQTLAQRQLISIRQQFEHECDLISVYVDKRINLEYDFKREPYNARMEVINGIHHLCFDTRPWKTADEGLLARAIFEVWRKENCLKTIVDFENWQEYYAERLFIKECGTRIKLQKDGLAGVLKRLFLYAQSNTCWGCLNLMSYRETATRLTDLGYRTSENDVKNAKRSKILQADEVGILPATPAVLVLWGNLLTLQPLLNPKCFFMQDQLVAVTNFVYGGNEND